MPHVRTNASTRGECWRPFMLHHAYVAWMQLRFWCCPVWRQPQTTQKLRKNKTSDGKLWRKTMNNHEEKRWITWRTIWKTSTLPDPKHQNHRGRVAHCRNPDHRSHPDAWSLQPCKASATMGNWPPIQQKLGFSTIWNASCVNQD